MRRSNSASVLISSILFVACLLSIWLVAEVLPTWVTDPYTHSAYKQAKQLSSDLQKTLKIYSKTAGMANNFSEFTTLYDSEKEKNSDIYSFESLIDKGVKIGSVDVESLKFNSRELDAEILEVRWQFQNVTATYKLLQGRFIDGHVRAIFNMGEIVDEDIESNERIIF